ncbi:hypothetical protein J7E88_24760 [Streptomyces sp. ISL-10]|uniref:hypothetical protein n=1 Tax=Streptomyces sp. ISL-10 TaxID=2819172 RepID=UPI001BEA1FE8|nr:hypothetical protein [Streptomyces sp. ISL-10]MBT2368447.1 hypothetical protein [Streptomyces sp. ISL-10]
MRIEETRTYLWTGAVGEALTQWRQFVHQPNRRLYDPGLCRLHRVALLRRPPAGTGALEGAICALPRRAARELRLIVLALDELDEPF